MKADMILTSRPDTKSGSSIRKDHFYRISTFILKSFEEQQELTFTQLLEIATAELVPEFPIDEIGWLIFQVKLDLEAKGMIKQKIVPGHPRRVSMVLIKGKARKYRTLVEQNYF